MEYIGSEEDASEAKNQYNPFWYSLDRFIPIDLSIANLWMPRADKRIARHYLRIHIILGWSLIPILLLAWTGIFDR